MNQSFPDLADVPDELVFELAVVVVVGVLEAVSFLAASLYDGFR